MSNLTFNLTKLKKIILLFNQKNAKELLVLKGCSFGEEYLGERIKQQLYGNF